jgi:hypothetical protein
MLRRYCDHHCHHHYHFIILHHHVCSTSELAERFVSKAMNLLCFTSPAFAPWKDMIRDLYFYVLKKKADVETGRRVLFLQQQQQQQQPSASVPIAGMLWHFYSSVPLVTCSFAMHVYVTA